MENTIKQIPRVAKGNCCPVCGRHLYTSSKETYPILVYNDYAEYIQTTAILFTCIVCDIACASSDILYDICKQYPSFEPVVIKSEAIGTDSFILKEEMYSFPPTPNGAFESNWSKKGSPHPHHGYKTYPIKGRVHGYQVYLTNLHTNSCPICGDCFKNCLFEIPVSSEKAVRFPFSSCGKHVFSSEPTKLLPLIENNRYAVGFLVNSKYWYESYDMAIDSFNKTSDASVMILMKEKETNNENILMIGKRNEVLEQQIQIADYRSDEIRTILTNVLWKRRRECVFNDQDYSIFSTFTKKGSANLILNHIMIGSKGGMSSSIKNRRYELVDLLLYSPKTDKYEIIKATLDKDSDLFFIDYAILKRFMRDYGNPGLTITQYSKVTRWEGGIPLQDESILYACGYNVSQKDGLSDRERHKILKEILDYEILDQKKLLQYLNGFISLHKGPENAIARSKWEHDIDFVIQYLSDPSSFFILK